MDPIDHDQGLLERLAALARSQRAGLAGLARREGLSPEDAVDCVQEAFCTWLTLARRGALPPSPDAWGPLLAGIVRNAARNRRRRHDRARPHLGLERLPAPASAEEAQLDRAAASRRLSVCVSRLCEVQRAVVTLRVLEDRSGQEVADSLGISAGHVAVLLYRAKRALRSCMGPGP
jgi:RNA polymerase sigma-70 factor (ECF subfamily)